MPDFMTQKRSGFAKKVILLDPIKAGSDQVVIGAGSNFTWTDTFTLSGIDEYNQTFVREIIFNRMELGAGTLAAWETADLNDKLPTATNPIVGPYLILDVIGDDYPNAGTVINAFENAYISTVSGGFGAAPGPVAENINVIYTNRLNGKEYAEKYGPDYQYPVPSA